MVGKNVSNLVAQSILFDEELFQANPGATVKLLEHLNSPLKTILYALAIKLNSQLPPSIIDVRPVPIPQNLTLFTLARSVFALSTPPSGTIEIRTEKTKTKIKKKEKTNPKNHPYNVA